MQCGLGKWGEVSCTLGKSPNDNLPVLGSSLFTRREPITDADYASIFTPWGPSVEPFVI